MPAPAAPAAQYSLLWFVNLFEDTIARAEKSKDLAKRIESLIAHFTASLYAAVCRSLFEKDKLLFAFSLTVAIRAHIKHALDLGLFRFLLTGGISTAEPPPNPSDWLSDKCWAEMVRLWGEGGKGGYGAAARRPVALSPRRSHAPAAPCADQATRPCAPRRPAVPAGRVVRGVPPAARQRARGPAAVAPAVRRRRPRALPPARPLARQAGRLSAPARHPVRPRERSASAPALPTTQPGWRAHREHPRQPHPPPPLPSLPSPPLLLFSTGSSGPTSWWAPSRPTWRTPWARSSSSRRPSTWTAATR